MVQYKKPLIDKIRAEAKRLLRDYAHFLSIARGSLFETITQLQIAQDLGYIGDLPNVDDLVSEVGRMLTTMFRKFGTLPPL